MTKLRGRCDACGGPLWRVRSDGGCRLCQLESDYFDETTHEEADRAYQQWLFWSFARRDEANSTEGTPATSMFMPLHCREWTCSVGHGLQGDDERLDVWLEHAGATAEMGRPDFGGSTMWALFPSAGFRRYAHRHSAEGEREA